MNAVVARGEQRGAGDVERRGRRALGGAGSFSVQPGQREQRRSAG